MSAELKDKAARAALECVEDGMRLGIGTGSTADAFIRALGEKVAAGFRVIGVPTSERSAALCRELAIPLTTLEETPELDLAIDGADEIDAALNCIKGGGGAHLREKIVASAARRFVVIADDTKLVKTLGAFPLPIEVVAFGMGATRRRLDRIAEAHGLEPAFTLRQKDGVPVRTDSGHVIFDASFGRIPDPEGLAASLDGCVGVVEHGLFLNMAERAFLAGATGVAELTADRA